jgi:hypothetical protein
MKWQRLVVAGAIGVVLPVFAGSLEAHAGRLATPPEWEDAPTTIAIGQAQNLGGRTVVVFKNESSEECLIHQFDGDRGLTDDYFLETRGGIDQVAVVGGLFDQTTFCAVDLTPLIYNNRKFDFYLGAGNDVMESGRGEGWCHGEAGGDKLESFAAFGRMLGGDGPDIIGGISALATDWLQGDDGDDCLHDSGNNTLLFDCGPGTDRYWDQNTPVPTCEMPQPLRCFPPAG